jgi:hypothetical protein
MKGEGLSKKRPLEVADIAGGRREKRQKMGRSKEDEAKRAARKLIEKRLREEARNEMKPILLGSLAMIASTLSNQGKEMGKCDCSLATLLFHQRSLVPPPLVLSQPSLVCWENC